MARGDVVEDLQSVNAAASLIIRPGTDIEWVIHNIYVEAEVEIYKVKGGNKLLFDSQSSKGGWFAYFFHLTNEDYIEVKNTNAAAKLMSYDGVVSSI